MEKRDLKLTRRKTPCGESKDACPDRKPGCAIHCEKWAEYTKARDAEYAQRAKQVSENSRTNAAERRKRGHLNRTKPGYYQIPGRK